MARTESGGDELAIQRQISVGHAARSEPCLEALSNGAPGQCRKPANGGAGTGTVINQKAGDAFLNDLRSGAPHVGDHWAPAGHGLDHDQTERLRPSRHSQETYCTAEKFGFLAVTDLANVFNRRLLQQRTNLGLEILAIDLVDF